MLVFEHCDAYPTPPMPRRRRFLIATGMVAGALAVGVRGSPVQAQNAAAGATGASDSFLALSRLLTGRSQLDTQVGERMFIALSHGQRDFAERAGALARFAQSGGFPDVEALAEALDKKDPDQGKFLRQMVAAWYTGAVGTEADAKVVTYVQALMFQPVNDVLMPPSYCQAAPHYWVAKPPMV